MTNRKIQDDGCGPKVRYSQWRPRGRANRRPDLRRETMCALTRDENRFGLVALITRREHGVYIILKKHYLMHYATRSARASKSHDLGDPLGPYAKRSPTVFGGSLLVYRKRCDRKNTSLVMSFSYIHNRLLSLPQSKEISSAIGFS